MRILLIEDDSSLSEALAAILENSDYQVEVASDGLEGLSCALNGNFDEIILDIMLPGMNGFEVLSEIRARGVATPVMLLTARDSLHDKVAGLEGGADDYLTKPFAPAELLARLRALTRRFGEASFDHVSLGNTSLDLNSCMLSCGDKEVHLGFKEFSIMRILMTSSSCVTSKETLISKVWGSGSMAEGNNVEVYISFLRKKLAFVGSDLKIVTLRKVGYRLDVGEK